MHFLPFIEIILPLILVCTGTLQTVIYFIQKKNFDKWPVVAAEVIFTKLYDSPHRLSFMGREYEAIVHFKYSFRGKEYISETPFLKGYMLFSRMSTEQKIFKKYSVGELYNARVNPEIPETAFFGVKPIHRLSAILVPIGAIFYFGFIFGYYALIKSAFF